VVVGEADILDFASGPQEASTKRMPAAQIIPVDPGTNAPAVACIGPR